MIVYYEANESHLGVVSGKNNVGMPNVLPLTQWKDKSQDSDVQDFILPVKSRKRKLTSGDKEAKKPRL